MPYKESYSAFVNFTLEADIFIPDKTNMSIKGNYAKISYCTINRRPYG